MTSQPDPPRAAAPRILLAEDGLVNQRVAAALLAQQGYDVTVAANGREAVQRAAEAAFDVVLMDLEMPELDGLEATRLIRQHERQTGRHVPILAMTAHSSRSDHELCLQAGMDGFVAKPIRAPQLLAALRSFGAAAHGAAVPDAAPPAAGRSAAAPAVDWAAALAAVHGNRAVLDAAVAAAKAEIPELLRALRDAVAAADPQRLRRTAHTLKAALRYLAAEAATGHARRLEEQGQAADLAAAGATLEALEQAVSAVMADLDQPERFP